MSTRLDGANSGSRWLTGVELADVTQAPAPEGRKLLRLEVRNAETPIERKPEWIKTRAKMGPEYNAAAEPGEVRGPAHGLPGGRLPQHLRVLGGPRGDVPHRRRPVHPALRLLPDRHRQAASRSTATSRAGSPSRCRRWGCATPPSPASPATTCPTAAPGCTPRPCAPIHELNPGTGVENLIPDFNGKPDLLREVFESRPEVLAHNVETVPRIFKRIRPAFRYDRSLDVHHPGPRLRPGHQVQPDPRHGRDPRGGPPGAARPARRRLRAGHDHPVPPPLGAPPPRRALGQARGVRRARGRGRARSASPACCPGRWCVRRTAPVGCTVRPWTPARARTA